jgi:hypothetical protein
MCILLNALGFRYCAWSCYTKGGRSHGRRPTARIELYSGVMQSPVGLPSETGLTRQLRRKQIQKKGKNSRADHLTQLGLLVWVCCTIEWDHNRGIPWHKLNCQLLNGGPVPLTSNTFLSDQRSKKFDMIVKLSSQPSICWQCFRTVCYTNHTT